MAARRGRFFASGRGCNGSALESVAVKGTPRGGRRPRRRGRAFRSSVPAKALPTGQAEDEKGEEVGKDEGKPEPAALSAPENRHGCGAGEIQRIEHEQ